MSLPGRLGDPERTLGTDPRADPRMVAALAAFGLDQRGEAPPVTPSSPREEQLAYSATAEAGFEALFGALYAGLPTMEGVTSETVTIAGRRRPRDQALRAPPGRLDRNAALHRPPPRGRHGDPRGGGRGVPALAGRAGGDGDGGRRRGVPQRRRPARRAPLPVRSRRLRRRAAVGERSPRRARRRQGRRLGRVRRWGTSRSPSPCGPSERAGSRRSRCLRAVPVHLERVGDEAGRPRVAARERRLLPGLRRHGGDGRGVRPGRSPCR